MRRILAGLAGLSLGLTLMAAPASAAPSRQSFQFFFPGDPQAGAVGPVVTIGAVNGVGTDRTVAITPNPDGTVTDTDVVTLAKGTLTIQDTDTAGSFTLDPVSCIGSVSGSGPYTIVGGTGAYAGATGAGRFEGRGVLFFTRTAGGCSEQPRSPFFVVKASGTISLP